MKRRIALAQAALARLRNAWESKGWSTSALLYIYNLHNSPENCKTEEEFEKMLLEGDMTLGDFIVLFLAVEGVI